MKFIYTIEIDIERIEGKFASRDEISEAIASALDDLQNNIELDGLGADCESVYEVTDLTWDQTK